MPTYEYHCAACDRSVEIFQSMTADPVEICPNCGEKALHRLISGGTGIIFKGHGFYCTDYKSGSSTASSTSGDSSSSSSTSSSSGKKTETPDKKESAPAKEAAPKKEGK